MGSALIRSFPKCMCLSMQKGEYYIPGSGSKGLLKGPSMEAYGFQNYLINSLQFLERLGQYGKLRLRTKNRKKKRWATVGGGAFKNHNGVETALG